MIKRFHRAVANFWTFRVLPVLMSPIPMTEHTVGAPEKRKMVWLGITLKEWTVSPEEAEQTRKSDIKTLRFIAGRSRR